MNFLFWIASTTALISAPVALVAFLSRERHRKRLKHIEIQLATVAAQAELYKKTISEIKELRDKNTEYLEQKSIAVTELQELQKKILVVVNERYTYLREKEEAMQGRMEAEKKVELAEQKMLDMEKRMQDWELQRGEALQAAKASILEAGGQLSNKLLEDHKRETEAAKQESEQRAKKASEELLEKMLAVTSKVAALNEQNRVTQDKMAVVWRSLASPGGAGFLAEVGLENSLKNLGLEPLRDYIMQYAINGEGGNLRPDAVIFLPQDMLMVIDSKASKFLLDIAEAEENGELPQDAFNRLKKTMNDHLKALVSKDYRAAIGAMYKESGRSSKSRNILNVMYLPSENAVTHIKRADPEFISKCEKADIILAGPASLAGLLSIARLNIGTQRQAENQDAIIASVQELLDNMVVVLGYADKMGRGIKAAADNFDQFARSVNKRMLPKIRQLVSLGVKPNKSKDLPSRLVSYDMRPSDDMLTIEGDVEMAE